MDEKQKQIIQDESKKLLKKDKPSVTTFHLSINAIESLESLAKKFNKSYKEICDSIWSSSNILDIITENIEEETVESFDKADKIKKMLRVSKTTLEFLNSYTKKTKFTRDFIASTSMVLFKLISENQTQKDLEHRKLLLQTLNSLEDLLKSASDNIKKINDDDDTIASVFEGISDAIYIGKDHIREEFDQNIIIDGGKLIVFLDANC